ncbi:putative UDP-rhamnose:rhamnosyltransferase 1 [Vigna angularis]|nr:putative UDP-rhamnose:rhamnosyltransferase 1 [Vigna angularis]
MDYDLLITGSNLEEIDEFKRLMEAEFEMTDLVKLKYFLGMEFTQTTTDLVMHQQKYVRELLEWFKMTSCNSVKSPLEVNVKLRKDETEEEMQFDVQRWTDQQVHEPTKEEPHACCQTDTSNCGILFQAGRRKDELKLISYGDSDYGGDPVERKSTFGGCKTSSISMADKELHIVVFPWLAFGHNVPFLELAKLIAQKGHKISFISTPKNIHRLPKLPENLKPLLHLIEFPLPHVEELPENAENTLDTPPHLVPYLFKAYDGLEEPLTEFLEKSTPDWVICDFAPHWLPPLSSKLGIPCIFFSSFAACASSFGLELFKGKKSMESGEANLLRDAYKRTQVGQSSPPKEVNRFLETLKGAQVFATRSCMEIEGEFVKSLESLSGKLVIPTGLLPASPEDSNDHNWHTILNWLDKWEKGSVIYVAFGTEVKLSDEDFTEIAVGLELSGFPFFWAVKNRNISGGSVESQDWIENESKRGMIWRTWAPQSRILAHKSVGAFLTHCGWNSVIEGLQVGCPLVMLPFQYDQWSIAKFMEEKKVGVKVHRNEHDSKFTRDSVAKALTSVMTEEEGKYLRKEAQEMSKIVGDKQLQLKYVNEFVDYMKNNRSGYN